MPIALATSGLLGVLASWGAYIATMPKGTVPARPVGHIFVQVVGILATAAAIGLWLRDGGVHAAAVFAPAVVTLTMALLFLWLLTQRKTPLGNIQVAVGDSLLPFAAQTSDGVDFHSDTLAGQRILLKFFRGSW